MALVELRDIRKSFSMGKEEVEILHGISISVEKSEFVAMMGPSGSGKSTTMNILGCLDKPTSGTYILNGQNINDLEGDDLAVIRNRTIGFVFQGFNLLQKTSAIENVELPLLYAGMTEKRTPGEGKRSLDPDGTWRTGFTIEPTQLSGGQQQRVAIARGIVNRAPILMADEPTGNLDSKTSDEIMKLFKKINEEDGTTILLVTHEPDVAAYAKRIVHFKDGMITSDEINREVKVS